MLGISAHAQQRIITATLTVTNAAGTANTNTITLNGVTRNFTNYVANYQTSILASNSIWAASSNIFLAYIIYAQGSVVVSQPNTNQIGYVSYPNAGLTLSISPGWGTVSWFTNSITNSIVVRVPVSSVGIYDLTNIANGLRDYLNSAAVTNPFASSAPAFANLATLGNIQSYSLLNTNFTMLVSNYLKGYTLTIGNNSTNFAMVVSNYYYNLFNSYNIPSIVQGGPAFYPLSDFQAGSLVLSNLVADYPSGIPANLGYYLNAGLYGGLGNDIYLGQTNTYRYPNGSYSYDPLGGDSITRLLAKYDGSWEAMFEDAKTFLQADTSHNVEIYDDAGTARIQVYDASGGTPQGGIYLAGSGGQHGWSLSADGVVNTMYPVTSFTAGGLPLVAMGTVTNFTAAANNSGSSGTDVNAYSIPGNMMTNNGDCMVRTIGVLLASSTSSREVDVYFDGTEIAAVGPFAFASGGSMSITSEVTRTSSSAYTFNTTATITGATTAAYANVNTHGGVDFTSALTPCKLTLTASSTGAASNQITVLSDNTVFKPAAAWEGAQ